jgi:RNA exonuclease NGL2
MLTKELTHYQPTILCLQEVDLKQYEPYFVTLLHALHYDHVLLAAKRKRQGLLIAWKEEKYELFHRRDIHYDLLNAGAVGPTMWTGNVGICLGLKQRDTSSHGVWIANTHLYWHPHGSYERQRQAGVLVSQTMDFAAKEPKWPVLICGGNIKLIRY